MTKAQLKLMALRGRDAVYSAYLVALDLWRSDYEDAGAIIDKFRSERDREAARFLKLVADALQDGAQFKPTTCRHRLIMAHDAAWLEAVKRAVRMRDGKRYVSVPDVRAPTMQEWITQFERLFPDAPLPADSTFRRTATELSLLYSRSVRSADKLPRKRRGLKSRAKKVLRRC
jgi:hypothetical protein